MRLNLTRSSLVGPVGRPSSGSETSVSRAQGVGSRKLPRQRDSVGQKASSPDAGGQGGAMYRCEQLCSPRDFAGTTGLISSLCAPITWTFFFPKRPC